MENDSTVPAIHQTPSFSPPSPLSEPIHQAAAFKQIVNFFTCPDAMEINRLQSNRWLKMVNDSSRS